MKSDIQLINENQLELVSGGTLVGFACLLKCCCSFLPAFVYGFYRALTRNNNPLIPHNTIKSVILKPV